jgi:hypothetical protein
MYFLYYEMSEENTEHITGISGSYRDLITLQGYMDGIFRLIILTYSLCIAALAFARGYTIISVILSLIIVLSLSYAFFTIATVGAILLTFSGYNIFNLLFYIISTVLLTLLFFATVYYIWKSPAMLSRRSK